MRVYALLDRKLREYGMLTLYNNDETVVRALGDALSKPAETPLHQHPEDFDLMCVAEFDVNTGVMQGRAPEIVVNVSSLVNGGG